MPHNYYELAHRVLTQPASAPACLDETERLLCQDPFNPSLLFANGVAAFQTGKITAAFVHAFSVLKTYPDWIPRETADELIPKIEAILNGQLGAEGIKQLGAGRIAGIAIQAIDTTHPPEQFSAATLLEASSQDIEEYNRFRHYFDTYGAASRFSDLPPVTPERDATLGHDLKIALCDSPATKPLVIFFQGFYSMLCPDTLRIPSIQIPYSQENLCHRIDPERTQFSRIFVRDHFQVWYQAGLHGRGSPDTLARQLAALIQAIAPTRTLTLGTSAGGFASLLFGHLVGARTSLAFSPQTVVFAKTPDSFLNPYRVLFYQRFLEGRPYLKTDLLTLAPLRTKARVYYATGHEGDRFHAKRLSGKAGFKLFGQTSDTHAGYLNEGFAERELARALAAEY